MKVVFAHYNNGIKSYLFGVPEHRDIEKDTKLIVKNVNGNSSHVVSDCASFELDGDALKILKIELDFQNLVSVCGEVVTKEVIWDCPNRDEMESVLNDWCKGHFCDERCPLSSKNKRMCYENGMFEDWSEEDTKKAYNLVKEAMNNEA